MATLPNLKEILELSDKEETVAESTEQPEKPRWLLSTILVFAFFAAGLLLVVLPWFLCLRLIADEQSLIQCLHLAVLVGPGTSWVVILALTWRRENQLPAPESSRPA